MGNPHTSASTTGISPSALKHMRQLVEENRRLKRLIADLSPDKAMLQGVLAKKSWHVCGNGSGIYRPDRVPAKGKSVLRYGSPAVRSDIVQLLPMTAHCACVSVRSLTREFTTDIAGYTSCSGVRVGATITNGSTGSSVSRGCHCLLNVHGAINPRRQPEPRLGMDFVSDALFNGRRLRLLAVSTFTHAHALGSAFDRSNRDAKQHSAQASFAAVGPVGAKLQNATFA